VNGAKILITVSYAKMTTKNSLKAKSKRSKVRGRIMILLKKKQGIKSPIEVVEVEAEGEAGEEVE